MRGKNKLILIFCTAILISAAGNFILAQRPLEVDYPAVGGIEPQTTATSIPEYVKYIFNFSLGIAGLVVFIVLVYAGFRYLTSAGDPGKQKDARDRIIAAFLGLLVLLLSYIILTTINPQLVVLSLPGKMAFSLPPAHPPPSVEPSTLYYTEIPVRAMIEQLFLKEKMDEIKEVSENLRAQAEKVKNLSNELKALVDACSCSYVDIGTCEAGSCGGSTECTNNCYCAGEPRENFDPCPNRSAIDAKRDELKAAVNTDKTGLKYWQKEFEERAIDYLRKIYNDLLLAEQTIKTCSDSTGKTGTTRLLSIYKDFLTYRRVLEEGGTIKKVESDSLFSDYSITTTLYESATFYCSEVSGPAQQLAPPSEEPAITDFGVEETKVPSGEIFCEDGIPIGQTIDNAEELARRMLIEMDNINSNTLGEINNAETLFDLPEDCRGSNCGSNMDSSRECCEWTCGECCEPPPECDPATDPTCSPPPGPEPPPEPPPEPCWECEIPFAPQPFFAWLQEWLGLGNWSVYAQPGGCQYGCCADVCVYDACTSCSCSCTGSPCPDGSIDSAVSAINNHYNEIVKSRKILVDLIGEKVDDWLKITNIFKMLDFSNGRLGMCYNPIERYGAIEASENTSWDNFFSCSEVKQFAEFKMPLIGNNGEEITQCYGSPEPSPDSMDDFFCCTNEISF